MSWHVHIHLSYHTAVIPTPMLQSFIGFDSVARFLLTQATAERSGRYISSLERTDLGVPLDVEFEETQSSGTDGDMLDRHVSAPGAVYNVQIWSINGANFSYDPLVAATTLLFDKGIESGDMVHYTNCLRSKIYNVLHIISFYCTCTAPSVPRLLSVTRILSDGFELNWLPPRELNGRPVYEIEYGTDDTNFTAVDTGNNDTYYNLTGLQHSTIYYIRVVAVNYFTPDLPLRGNESETVTGVIMPEPGEDYQWDAAIRY